MSKDYAASRRQLFKGGAVAAAAALPGASTVMTAVAGRPFAMQNHDDWKSHVGKEFAVNGNRMKLVQVSNGHGMPVGRRGASFTATFEMDAAAAPASGLHQVAHAELGEAALYLQSGTREGGKARVHAAFS